MASGVNFTKNQQSAIDICGGNILVSAAAGSGKTAVLTERVIRLLTGDNPISADNLVIVTFTVLAAGEMKSRINEKLSKLIEEDPENKLLQNQQLLLPNAKISTIHSLCSSLIKDNFQNLNVSSNSRMVDETELNIFKNDAISEVFEEQYDKENPAFLNLVEFTCVKDDKPLCELVKSIYDYIRSFPFPKEFMMKTIQTYENSKSITENIWYSQMRNHVIDALKSQIKSIDKSIETMRTDSQVFNAYFDAFDSDKKQIDLIINFLQDNKWDNAILSINNISKAKLKSVTKYEDKDFLSFLQGERKQVYLSLETIKKNYLSCNSDEFLEDVQLLLPQLKTLFSIVHSVYDIIEEKKKTLEIMDYADLEHYTLNLLINKTDSGYEKSKLAETLSQSIGEIMIDECQDINEVQNLIFKLLSKDEKNLFMVGDVKQSVYRFRKAQPHLFIKKMNSFSKYNKESHTKNENASITLESNFRSRKEVCEFVNFIFSQIMSDSIGEINYEKSEYLVPKADFPENELANPEIHIIDYDKQDDRLKQQVEAHYIANKIKNMVASNYQVCENKKMRACRFGDFAILLRSKKDTANIFASELKNMGIPSFTDSTNGYFNEYEIAVTLNLLRVIDNPLQDVCLLSVMMSPMFSFNADLIANIRATRKKISLYLAVVDYAKTNKQCEDFISAITNLRQRAAVIPTDELVQEIYDQTDFISLCYAMGNGKQKDANLRLLLTYTKQYEAFGGGLAGFLRYIDRIISNKQDFYCANPITQSANTVKIMTIHSSKGLEFPICIIADCAKQFNKMDLKRQYQFNPELLFGMKISDNEKLLNYSNLPYEAIKLQTEKETISEEMRVLYVALTRAKEKLIMVMTLPKAEKKIASLANRLSAETKIEPYDVFKCNSYSDWLIITALRHKGMAKIANECGAYNLPKIHSDFSLTAFLVHQGDIEQKITQEQTIFTAKPNEKIIANLESVFNFKYSQEELTKIPVKLTVTQIAKQAQNQQYNLDDCPKFLENREISPEKRGTILHSFMQYANFDNAKNDVESEIKRLVTQSFLTQVQADTLEIDKIQAFFDSDLYKRIENSEKVMREYKFLHFINACDIMEIQDKSTQILIQGIADCIFFEDDSIVLVDYKTDRTNSKSVLIERYKYQLKIYKKAIEQAFNLPVSQCLLFSMNMKCQIDI